MPPRYGQSRSRSSGVIIGRRSLVANTPCRYSAVPSGLAQLRINVLGVKTPSYSRKVPSGLGEGTNRHVLLLLVRLLIPKCQQTCFVDHRDAELFRFF